MSSVLNVKDCYGCGLCSIVCKQNVIEMRKNKDGFYQPTVMNRDRCIDCSLCVKVCSFINEHKGEQPIHCYAAWSKDICIRKTSTSGGVSFEVAKSLLLNNYKFCGVKYNIGLKRAEHYIASNIDELELSKGSKYLQSFTADAFSKIDRKNNYLVVGTPCQIASFRRYIDLFRCQENFILMDFFCHGVPSYLLWEKYLEEHACDLGEIKTVTWRNKLIGWHKSYCITIEGEKNKFQSWKENDDFYTMFLGDACLSKACYNSCKFKYNQSSADIRIGDFWGKSYQANEEGLCSVIAFTKKGDSLLKEANIELVEYPMDIVAEGQMRTAAMMPLHYKMSMATLKNKNKKLSHIARYVYCYKRGTDYINRIKQILHL